MRFFADIQQKGSSLSFRSSYDPGLIAALKAEIPHTDRRWDPTAKAWLVAPQHGQILARLCNTHLGIIVPVPSIQTATCPEIRILDIRYLGKTKSRPGADERTAYGFSDGSWSVVIPESVLLTWFSGLASRAEATTLYGLLGVKRTASQDLILAGFRRLAFHWHPDRSSEPDAAEMFIKIKSAYDLLSDPRKRSKYDAGLALEATLGDRNVNSFLQDYQPPLRCGYVQAEGVEQVGRFVVSKIYAWEEIINSRGQVLVTSWPFGADMFSERWV